VKREELVTGLFEAGTDRLAASFHLRRSQPGCSTSSRLGRRSSADNPPPVPSRRWAGALPVDSTAWLCSADSELRPFTLAPLPAPIPSITEHRSAEMAGAKGSAPLPTRLAHSRPRPAADRGRRVGRWRTHPA